MRAQCQALDLSVDGIRVNAVSPQLDMDAGGVQSGHRETAKNGSQSGGSNAMMRRLGEPREVARAILFLCSDNASFITGTEFDGRWRVSGSGQRRIGRDLIIRWLPVEFGTSGFLKVDQQMASNIDIWGASVPGFNADYGQPAPFLTPYLVESSAPTGAIIVCPGGGYQFKADYEGGPVAVWLNTLGISAFVLDYRVSPYQHPYPVGRCAAGDSGRAEPRCRVEHCAA